MKPEFIDIESIFEVLSMPRRRRNLRDL